MNIPTSVLGKGQQQRKQPMGTRESGVLIIKALAIIGVVFHHIGNRRLDPDADLVLSMLPALFSWAVLTFFSVSGYLHALSAERRSTSVPQFLKSRFLRLLVPWVFLIVVYAAVWEVVQHLGILRLRGSLADGFFGKIVGSLSAGGGDDVAEQLYFLPLLFLVASTNHIALRLRGYRAIGLICAASLLCGLIWFSPGPTTGFSLGLEIWGTFCYSSGAMVRRFSHDRRMPIVILAVCATILAVGSILAAPKAIAILLLLVVRPFNNWSFPLFEAVGEASGTTYAYHTPFVLQPLVILCTLIPSTLGQVVAVIAAASVTIALCTMLHQFLVLRRIRILAM